MKSENIKRYTAEELRARKSETNWEKVDSITDEELERLIMEDPENEGAYTLPGWVASDPQKGHMTIPATSIDLRHALIDFMNTHGMDEYEDHLVKAMEQYTVEELASS